MDETKFEDICLAIIQMSESKTGINNKSEAWLKLDHLFFWHLHQASEAEMLKGLELDVNESLPFYMRIEIYQRLILVNEKRAKTFEDFAHYLRGYSNNWNYLAEYFEIIASRLSAKMN